MKHTKKIISFTAGVILAVLAYASNVNASTSMPSNEEVIQTYYDNVNNKDVNKILDSLDGEYGESANAIYTDEENINNNVGIFNISNAEVLSIEEASSSDISLLDMTGYDDLTKIYKVRVNITTYHDGSEFIDGINEIYFFFNGNNKIIGCQTLGEMPKINNGSGLTNGFSLFSYDAPVKKPASNPSTIKVYRTSTRKIQSVKFKTYCKVVTTCEVGYSNWNKEALRACALAIKNYGIVRVKRHKYSGLGYDVKDNTSDQVYNPNKERVKKCDNAVDYIWNYYLVDSKSKVFPGFHVANSKINSYASKHKGILSQEKAQSLASKNGYTWKQILKYFYTREKGKSYYNSEVAVGTVSVVK